jgi:hypothetical protein
MKKIVKIFHVVLMGSLIVVWNSESKANVAFRYHEIDSEIGHPLIGDMNGDGHGDIVVHVHRDDTHIKDLSRVKKLIWYHWPDWSKHTIATGDMTGNRFCLADINGDGRLDAISGMNATSGVQHIYWFENPLSGSRSADGSSWTAHDIGVCDTYIKDIVAGDVDSNGQADVVVRGHAESMLYFQKNDTWRVRKVKHPRKEGMDLADLDLDGDLDIILNGFWLETPDNPMEGAYEKHCIDETWFTQKTGSWQDNCCYVGAADINQDGIPDVVLSHSENVGYPLSWYSVETLAQVKTGPWMEHRIASEFPWCETVDIGDVDNDGDLDVLASKFRRHDSAGGRYANAPPYPVTLFFNRDGRGLSWSRQDVNQDGIYAGMLGDAGGDGDLDIVGPLSYYIGPIKLWENRQSDEPLSLKKWQYIHVDNDRGKWGDEAEPGWLRYFGLAMGDLTGDGYQDIVSGRYVYRNPGGDMTRPWQRIDFGRNVDAILVTDVDGDGLGDVIAQALPTVYWLEAKDSHGSQWSFHAIGTVPKTGHVNSQGFDLGQIIPGGRPEIVLAAEDGIYYFEIPDNPQKAPWPRVHVTNQASDEGLDVRDIDGDGWYDIAAGNGEQYVAWWKNPGTGRGQWQRYILGTTQPHPADRLRLADINGDGRTDLVVTEERYPGKEPDANLFWFQQPSDPTARWERHHIITEYSLNNLDVADFDRDGDVDIVTCEHKGPNLQLQLFENDGQGHFSMHVIDKDKESHLGTLTADLDGDGDLDIVSIGWDRYQHLHVWRNDAIKIR